MDRAAAEAAESRRWAPAPDAPPAPPPRPMNADGQEIRIPPPNSDEQVGKTEKTVIELSELELRQFYHDELNALKFDPSQDQLGHLLKEAGENVVGFFRDFSNVSSRERVEMLKKYKMYSGFDNRVYTDCTGRLTPSAGDRRAEDYQYLILPGKNGAFLGRG